MAKIHVCMPKMDVTICTFCRSVCRQVSTGRTVGLALKSWLSLEFSYNRWNDPSIGCCEYIAIACPYLIAMAWPIKGRTCLWPLRLGAKSKLYHNLSPKNFFCTVQLRVRCFCSDSQAFIFIVQISIFIMTCWISYEFFRFMLWHTRFTHITLS